MPIQDSHCRPSPSRPPSPALNSGRSSRRVPPRGDCTMPVRTRTTRTPACSAGRGRVFPFGDHVGKKAVAAIAVLGQRLVAAVVAVEADR